MRRLVATLSGLALVLSGTGAAARTLPNYDALQDAKPAGRVSAGFKSLKNPGARVAHQDERTHSPTFIWVNKSGAQTQLSAQYARMAPEQAALVQLADHAPLYGLSSFESAGARVVSVSPSSRGTKVVTIGQEAAGLEVFRQNLKVLLNRNNEVVAISGTLSKHVSSNVPAARVRFQVSATEAVATAYRDLTGHALDGSLLTQDTLKQQDSGRYTHFTLASYARPLDQELVIPARVKQVLYSLPNALVPAYYVELNTGSPDSSESDYYAYVVSAADGRLLMRNNLTADVEYSYRVFADSTPPYTPHDGPAGNNATPHPTGVPDGFRPPFVAPALVTLQNAPFSQNDPWLAPGATVTTGNNVDAYADLVAPDNYQTGDLRPTVTAPGVFDRTMLFDIQPNANAEQIAAATTSLFFMNNWLHDWYYDTGFDEASGNAQINNFGRGGLGNDAIRAQAQDYGGTNNANMSTPADGASPRMQMYLFSGARNARLTVNAPGAIAGNYQVGIATGFGPQLFDVTGDVVEALDASDASGPSTTDACTTVTNAAAVAGKIALVDRGTCAFTIKMVNAQAAGAIGVVIADNAAGPVVDLGGAQAGITIPALRITQADGARLRTGLAGLNARLFRGNTINVDGTVDNIIVAHEWGHYISNRLIGNAAGLVNNQGRSMGEGWGDFTALLMVTRPEDINVPANANWTGAYGAAEYATRGISADSSFFGIRRVTYSVNMAKNALTFRHIQDGVPLPTTTPLSPGGVNSEVHNSGEVWATMLWECYVALLRAHPFQEAQDRMKNYLVNGYKMTPVAPTFLEARDAVLAAAYANDPADGQRLWAAFARRGAGVGAVAPDRYSVDHAGVVESFSLGTSVEIASADFADSATTPGDADGILDNGETGTLVFTVENKGSAPANSTSMTVFSPTPGVTVGNRGTIVFPAIPVGGSATASIPVSLNGATMAQRLDFSFALRDDGQAIPGDKTDSLAFKANYDEVPNATATETVEANSLPWVTDNDPALAQGFFDIVQFSADLNRAFYGPNLGAGGDIRLITPPLSVSATNPLVLSFRHAYDFEADIFDNYDGAVIELSNDGGATWADIGGPLYSGSLVAYTGNLNPLQGRNAFVGTTANFPELSFASLNLGTTYAGQTVQIRFRIGTDNAAAFTGWVLDDLSFSGITNTPFTKICDDSGVCANNPPVVSAGPDMVADERAPVLLSGSAVDFDGNALTYTWTRVSGPVVTFSGANTLTPSFTAPEVTIDTNLVLRLSVSDGITTVSDTVTVQLRNVNRAPTVNAGVDGSADERTSYTLTGSASDADNDGLTYLWTQVSGTPAALMYYERSSATFTAPEVAFDETLTFTLTVSDGKTSVSDTVDVVVRQVNRAPMVTASSVTVDERSTATLQATASDSDGDALTYAWTQLSGAPVTLSGADSATATFSTGEVSADSVLTFRVTVSDGQATASHDVVVNVRQINIAPTVNAGIDGSVNERASYTLTGSASDADGDTLSYSWVQVSGTPVGLSGANTATASFTAPETASGETLSFILTVSDGKASTSDTVNVVVNNVNRAPAVMASSVTADERSTASLQASGSDADGDALTYAWTQLSGTPVTLSGANTATATFSTGEVSADSVFTFRVTVSDGQATASRDVTVTVRNINSAPTVNAGVDGNVNERASYTLSGSASDADGDALSYSWVQVSGTPAALSGANTATATFTAPETASGETLSFTLTVNDGKLTASDTVNVVVNNVNRAPVVTASSVSVDERSTATLQASGSDADGDALTYAWTQLSGTPVTLSGANTATATFSTGEVSADSVLTFRVTVSDGQSTATQDVVVNVRQVNVAPTVNAGVDGNVNERASYTLSGSASDADGDALSYSWVQVSGTPAALSGANTATATFTAPETASGETLSFVLSVSDGKASSSDTVNVVVNNVNRAPVVTAPSVTADERSTATLQASGSDADGDALTYAWTQLSGTPVTLSGADTATATFSTGEVSADSVFTFRVTVGDGQATASHDVTVTVRNINTNSAPTVNAGLDGTVNERASYTLSGSASDADGDTLSYSWVQVSGTPVALSGANTATATFTAPETASGETLSFTLTVNDGKLTASDTVNVVVNNVNRAPTVTAPSVTVDERSTATLHATGSDADGDALTYAWTQLTGTPVVLSGADTATATFSTGEVSADSVLTFRVTVLDGHVTASHDVTVNVRQVNVAPTANAGQDGSVNERASYTLSGSASDVDGDTLSYSWVQVSGTPVGLSGANTATASFTAPETVSGETLSFILTVSDGKASSRGTVSVVVNNVNRAPVVTSPAVVVDERSTASLVATASDPDSDALTYAWTQLSGTPVTLAGANTASASFVAGDVTSDRTYTFRVSVSDGQTTTTRDVTVTVRNVNAAPVANAGSASSAAARATVTLDGSASAGSEGATLTYQWTQVGGPWATLAGADTATPTFTAPDVKTATELVFSLVVGDGSLTSAPSTVTVTVSPAGNTAPVAKARIIVSGSQTSMTLDGSASSDADGEALTYKWEQTAGPAIELSSATQAVLSVDVPASGTYGFRLTVTDARGATHSTTVEATATPATDTPDDGGCSATGSGAPLSVLGLALLGLLRRRRWLN